MKAYNITKLIAKLKTYSVQHRNAIYYMVQIIDQWRHLYVSDAVAMLECDRKQDSHTQHSKFWYLTDNSH